MPDTENGCLRGKLKEQRRIATWQLTSEGFMKPRRGESVTRDYLDPYNAAYEILSNVRQEGCLGPGATPRRAKILTFRDRTKPHFLRSSTQK